MKVLYLCILLILSIWVLIMVAFFSCSTAMQQPPVQQKPVEKDIVYVCGLAKDWTTQVEDNLRRVDSIVKPHEIILITAKKHNTTLHMKQIVQPSHLPPTRIGRIILLRNMCLRQIENENSNNWKHIKLIWVDTDMKIPDTALVEAKRELKRDSTYDVVCANGRKVDEDIFYYDVSATILIDGTFTYLTPWVYDKSLNRKIDFREINKIFPHNRRLRQNKYVPVKGCFGGMTIYKYPIYSCRYKHVVKNKKNKFYNRYRYNGDAKLCEHIPFHFCLQNRGAKLAVNLDMEVFWSGPPDDA
ncbi:MAG: hypothetical protein CMO44_14160 [Verrucomicrobiales bacterium]|nr:hypothetical protein [Verrucomicrobiales bacterium]